MYLFDGQNGIEFHQGKKFFGEQYILNSNQFTTHPTKIVEPNTIILCVRAPVGTVNITDRSLCIGRGLCGLETSKNIHKIGRASCRERGGMEGGGGVVGRRR